MYKGHYEVLLGEEGVSKIEELLRERWHAKEIVISRFKDGWKISFLTDDRKKIFILFGIIGQYGGEVVNYRIRKVERSSDVPDLNRMNTNGCD